MGWILVCSLDSVFLLEVLQKAFEYCVSSEPPGPGKSPKRPSNKVWFEAPGAGEVAVRTKCGRASFGGSVGPVWPVWGLSRASLTSFGRLSWASLASFCFLFGGKRFLSRHGVCGHRHPVSGCTDFTEFTDLFGGVFSPRPKVDSRLPPKWSVKSVKSVKRPLSHPEGGGVVGDTPPRFRFHRLHRPFLGGVFTMAREGGR